jgi:TnsA endonuclease N terminal
VPSRKRRMSAVAVTAVIPTELAVGECFAESSLERDLYRILRSRRDIERFEVQPADAVIEWVDETGKLHKYTPDVRVVYKPESWDDPGKMYGKPFRRTHKTEVIEVKYRSDLQKNLLKFLPKFRAAKRIFQERGERFTVLTEHTIRSHAMEYAKFLERYKQRHLDQTMQSEIFDKLVTANEISIDLLITSITTDPDRQLELLAAVWIMVANGILDVNRFLPPSRNSFVWLSDVEIV